MPDEPDLDLKSPANVRDPFPVYAWLRDHEPVHWSEGLNAWVVTRYADVLSVFDQPARFSSDRFRKLDARHASRRPEVRAVGDVLGDWLVFRDPPDHTRLRALLQKSFTPRHLDENRKGIQFTVDRLLDTLADRPDPDFIRDVAFPLPAMVIAILLGVPTEDIEPIKEWSDRLAAYLGGSTDESDNFSEARAGVSQLSDYFRARLAERRAAPRNDLMSLMLRAEDEGDRLSEHEVLANCVLLLFAGHETTTNLLGNGLHHLLQRPEAIAALRAEPGLVPTAVEELLRFDGPVPATVKIATADVELHGRRIPRGDMVMPFTSAANRDPRQFDEPERLDWRRRPNRHLAFGFGIHFCLGAPLARLEARLCFESLLRRFPRLERAAGDVEWKPMIFLRGLASLPVVFDDARAEVVPGPRHHEGRAT